MANETMIPCLPCGSIDEVLAFYVAMGFEITYQQTRPNIYGCVKRDGIDLHFFAMKGVDPANSYSTCLVLVDDVNALHATFTANLRQNLSRVPIAGIPRITKPNNKNSSGDFRFNVVDPGGNYIRFIQRTSPPEQTDAPEAALTKLGRAIRAADLLVNAKGDFAAAAKQLDTAMSEGGQGSGELSSERVKALILRAEIALNMDDPALAKAMLEQVDGIVLNDDERTALEGEFQRASELSLML